MHQAMTAACTAIARRWRWTSLARDTRGLAMIEFAIAAPVLITLGLGGAEITNMAVAQMRVNQVATSVSDNVARVRNSINEADVNEVLLSAALLGGSDFTANGRVVVSSVEPNGQIGTSAGQYIRWQRCTGALNIAESQPKYGLQDKGKTDNSLQSLGTAPKTIKATAGSALILVEVTYKYQPLVSARFLGTPVMRSEAVYNVRERNDQTLGSAAGATASVCTTYAA
jgi:Flp pilus assembly protein TadG